MISTNYIKEFKGGSMAKIFLVNIDNKLLVKKEVTDSSKLGIDKLQKQAQWMLNLENDISNMFPKITKHKFDNNYGYYLMEFYDMPTFRDYIIENKEINENIKHIIKSFINISFKISDKKQKIDLNTDYIINKHLNKMEERCLNVNNDKFINIFNSEYLIINNEKYLNFYKLRDFILNNNELLKFLSPNYMHRSHGDFTFQNILTNGKDFKIIDPRGEGDDSIYYDIGKLYQSCYAKYDLIYKDNFKCEFKNNKINYTILDNEKLFDDLFYIVKECIDNTFNFNNNWDIIAKFFCASHMISMTPFRYEESLESTIICYAIGITIMNEVIKEWKTLNI